MMVINLWFPRLGSIKPSLALSTLAVFVLVYFALWKGVKSTGKVRNDWC